MLSSLRVLLLYELGSQNFQAFKIASTLYPKPGKILLNGVNDLP